MAEVQYENEGRSPLLRMNKRISPEILPRQDFGTNNRRGLIVNIGFHPMFVYAVPSGQFCDLGIWVKY